MNKTNAIKHARKNVSELYTFGDGYKYNRYDATVNAWRESTSAGYVVARAYRAYALLECALQAMGFDDYAIHRRVAALSDNGGPWTNYVD